MLFKQSIILVLFILLQGFSYRAQKFTVDSIPKSIDLLHIDLVGVNLDVPKKKLRKLERYFERAGFRVFVDDYSSLQIDEIEVPSYFDQNILTYLEENLLFQYHTKFFKPKHPLTVFLLKKEHLAKPYYSYPELGILFASMENYEDNIVNGIGNMFGLPNLEIDTIQLQDTFAIGVVKNSFTTREATLEVKSNFNSTGMLNFCSWEEDASGNILFNNNSPLSGITSHYKSNLGIRYLDPSNWLFKPLFELVGIKICVAHILVVVFVLMLFSFFFWKINKLITKRNIVTSSISLGLKIGAFILTFSLTGLSFYFIDLYYQNHYVIETKLNEIDGGLSSKMVLKNIQNDINFEQDTVQKFEHQILKKRENNWYIARANPILIFQLDHENNLRFYDSKNTYQLENGQILHARFNHFYVIEHLDDAKNVISKKVYSTENRKEILSIDKDMFSKKTLLFVNGYRSMFTNSNDFNRNVFLKRISENKTEKASTKNNIQNHDVFDYWKPWNKIDKRFIHKIQPHKVLFADGHHSIETSNYKVSKLPFYIDFFNKLGNLGYFAFVAQHYPKQCTDLRNHRCTYVNIPKLGKKKTLDLLPFASNTNGFNERVKNGRIAGKNLLQSLNSPNHTSKDDSLFIVCHSMGFAYSLGIIDEIRGQIKFGGLYIIAPENPNSGRINSDEWDEVWHYGVDENSAECLQDGIAPQAEIRGLKDNRVFFPEKEFPNLGFSASHFVGNYTWIFDLKENEKGFIRQH